MRMLFFLLTTGIYMFVVAGCGADAVTEHGTDAVSTGRAARPQVLLTVADAEQILGEAAALSDSASAIEGQATIYRCTYAARDSNRDSKRSRMIYFFFEEYPNVTAAHEDYIRIKVANQGHEGIETLQGVGDEAYFHTDGTNFYYIMARKGRRGFRIKVTKISSTTSYDALMRIGRRIASEM